MGLFYGWTILLFLGIYWVVGLGFLAAYLISTPDRRSTATMLYLLFLPSLGWGRWRYERRMRLNGASLVPRSSLVWTSMGTLHAYMILASVLASFIVLTGLFTPHDPFGPDSLANQTSNASAVGFDFMMALGTALLGAVVLSGVIFSHIFLFLVVSVIPWVVGSRIRRQHTEEQLLEMYGKQAPPGSGSAGTV